MDDINTRMVMFTRHGTKVEMDSRYDLPIYNRAFCNDGDVTLTEWTQVFRQRMRDGKKLMMFASPFLRTKQTALRLAKKIGYRDPIYLIDALGEVYSVVMKQLAQCGEDTYRTPIHDSKSDSRSSTIDRCMRTLISNRSDLAYLQHSLAEVDAARFSNKFNSPVYPTSSSEHYELLAEAVDNLLDLYPDRDMIFVSHGGNVRLSLDILLPPRLLPRLKLMPRTCGSAVFIQESESEDFRLVYSEFYYL